MFEFRNFCIFKFKNINLELKMIRFTAKEIIESLNNIDEEVSDVVLKLMMKKKKVMKTVKSIVKTLEMI